MGLIVLAFTKNTSILHWIDVEIFVVLIILKQQNSLFNLFNFGDMTDVFSKEKRSEVMSKIRSKDTKPEIIIRKFLFSKGLRFRIHVKKLPGKPDIVLKRFSTIILVNGCFWHGHKSNLCKVARLPKSNTDFWGEKIRGNIQKDIANRQLLTTLGWSVIVVWECQLRGKKTEGTLNRLLQNFTTESTITMTNGK